MSKKAATTSLKLNGLRLPVFLGLYPEEKLKKQTVHIDAHIRFAQPPAACASDQLKDTYCYDLLIQQLKEKLADRKFQLLENFTKTLYDLLKEAFPEQLSLSVRVTKQPPIPELSQGVTFEYGDEACLWSS